MPATAYRHRKVVAASELHGTHHIAGIHAANNEGGVAVNQSIPDPASTGVAIVASIEHFATKPRLELLKRRQVHSLRSSLPCRLCCKNASGETMSVKPPLLLSLDGHPKDAGDERHLPENVSFFHATL